MALDGESEFIFLVTQSKQRSETKLKSFGRERLAKLEPLTVLSKEEQREENSELEAELEWQKKTLAGN